MTSRTALPANPFPVPERVLPALTQLDEYEIERVLAQSSFAVIYRAYDHALKLQVAIKEYLPDALALRSAEVQVVPRSPAHAERFELGRQAFIGEAQTLARCDHPALLRVLRILQRHGTVYRVMRYCPGPTLQAHRRDVAEAPDVPTLRLWLEHLLGALQALHEEGCVHGAVAPGNILLGADERPLLLDFDAVRATLISDRTQSMMAALEPCFAPLEQRQPAAHLSLGPWTDLYSLAASLHFCISGQLPTPPAIDAPAGFEPLGTLWHRLGLAEAQDAAPLLDALDACLAELPAQRPQSVAQFRALLVPGAVPQAARPVPKPAPQTAAVPEPPLPQPAPEATAAPLLPPLPPLPEASAVGTLNARIIADLDQTFAKIAASAQNTEAAAHDSLTSGAAGLDTTAPMGIDLPAPAARQPAPFSALRADNSAAALQGMAADPVAAPQAAASATAARQLRRQWLYVGLVLVALAVAGVALWWASMGDAPLSNHAAESPAATIDLPAAATASPPGVGALTLPPPAAGKAEPPPLPAQARQTIAAPPVKPVAPPSSKDKAKPKTAEAPPAALASPREACGKRTQFALYQCMQTQCAKPNWSQHEQCRRLRHSDAVD